MSSKLITVFGATGAQGGSVVQSLLANKTNNFSVRGITRNTESESSKKLVAQGVEMVQADGLVKEQVVAALKGSWGFFVNTNSGDKVCVSKLERWPQITDEIFGNRLLISRGVLPSSISGNSLLTLPLRQVCSTLCTVA